MTPTDDFRLGALPEPDSTRFRTWTDQAKQVAVVRYDQAGTIIARHPMAAKGDGLFEALIPGVGPGARYKFALDGQAWPDPYARVMPQGVHGPAEVWLPTYPFENPQPAIPLSRMVIYELHVGCFTPEGTYAAAMAKLAELKALGINTVELMPLAGFPGRWGWGYDGVDLFAPFAGYGSPDDLCRFIDEAHRLGMAVLLDQVYNHFGPDGNYLWVYSKGYFTGAKTPWGDALNYANPYLRQLIRDSAVHWLRDYHFDGLRLDATHAIDDPGPRHILEELAEHVHAEVPGRLLIAEDGSNDPRLVTRYGLDGIWADDFHHQVRVLLTGEQDGYYAGYDPRSVADLARCITRGWLYEGQGGRGKPADALTAPQFVYAIQNHDQIGNRAIGDRLHHAVSLEAYLAASTLLLFLPMTPLLFMGQEWAASTPFCFFSDHHGELGAAVSKGRHEEFKRFMAFSMPEGQARIPDPQDPQTFHRSKLAWAEREQEPHRMVLAVYRHLLQLRQSDVVLRDPDRTQLQAEAVGRILLVRRRHGDQERVLAVNFGDASEGLPGLDGEVLFATPGAAPDHVPAYGAVIVARSRESTANRRSSIPN